jgi:hypothetical protein|tara:strand:- start:1239 stop:1427 length:189 start_codon:yes stop_codon:yes gene_type:complete
MSLTLEELKEKIMVNADELLVLELLNISTRDLLEAFERRLIRDFDEIAKDFKWEEDDNNETE